MLKKASENERLGIMNYCMAEPSINLFIIGDIENFGFDCDFQEIFIQTANDRLTGIVLRYHDNFVIYSRDLDMDFHEVRAFMHTQPARIISGKQPVMELLYPVLEDNFTKREMHFCELEEGSRLVQDTSEVMAAKPEDAMEIALAYDNIDEFSGIYSPGTENRYRQILKRMETREGIHVFIRKDGRIVSHGNTTAETSVSGMIGGVLTLPGYRNLGFASKIVSALCKDLSRRGKSACLLFDNPEAGSIYHRLGFKDLYRWTILGVKKVE